MRYDPDVIEPDALVALLKTIEAVGDAPLELDTRIVEVPVLYNDPWTHETLMRFRERHQDPSSTDLEYAARINGKRDVDAFIAAHQPPWFVSMVGFVAGLPFMYQMVERERQLEVPKYLRPRTDTPKLTVGHGGCFWLHLLGARRGRLPDVRRDAGADLRPRAAARLPARVHGVLPARRHREIPADRSRRVRRGSGGRRGRHLSLRAPGEISLDAFLRDPDAYNRSLVEVLHAN